MEVVIIGILLSVITKVIRIIYNKMEVSFARNARKRRKKEVYTTRAKGSLSTIERVDRVEGG
jgi:hypothetical protein